MRFVIGSPPDSPDFDPERDGWRSVRIPSPGQLKVAGSAMGIVLCALVVLGWTRVDVTSVGGQINLAGLGSWAAVIVPLFVIFAVVLFFVGLTVVHELLHAVAFPRFGWSAATILGVWPRQLMPYADYQGPLPCWRFVLVSLMPFTFLSLLPLAVSLLAGSGSIFWLAVSVVNALVCGGDAVIGFVVIRQVPLGTVVRNKGWDTWWLPVEGR